MIQETDQLLKEITGRIVESIHPERIFLFGSRAWGDPTKASDVDLFIVVADSDKPAYRRAQDVYRCLHGLNVPIDVVVRTRDEVARSSQVANSLTNRVLAEGRLLYG